MANTHSRAGFVSRSGRVLTAGVLGSLLAIGTVGCNNAGEGALSGAALGSLAGLGIGSLYGEAGKGAAIGAIAGGVSGAVMGDQNERNARYHHNRRSDW